MVYRRKRYEYNRSLTAGHFRSYCHCLTTDRLGGHYPVPLFFPHPAAEAFWDELPGLPIAALVSFGVKSFLVREEVFHLLLTMDVAGINTVNLKLYRRRGSFGLLLMPTLQREAIIYERDTLVRNISWWACTVWMPVGYVLISAMGFAVAVQWRSRAA